LSVRPLAFLALLLLASACDDPKPAPPPAASTAASVAPPPVAPQASAAPEPSAHEAPSHISAQHILVAWKGAERCPKGVSRTKADAKKRADEVAKKAKEKGADFSALVAEYSDDPGAKERQGSLGKFGREKMAKPFSDAAFALAVDAVSEPVETPFGFHVIKRNQ